MRRVILLAMTFLPIMSMAAIPELSSLVKRYENISGVTALTMNEEMLGMYGDEEGLSEGVDEIVILATENGTLAANISAEAMVIIQRINLPLLTTMSNGGADTKVYVRQSDGMITDLVFLGLNGSGGSMVIISGKLDPNMLEAFMQVTQ